mmetsp:Transcript_102782/g.294592  ORF Transcript_102782/g.294592 Transcript_102782/m.294592 type:complete len:202 (-) Transcript_102782:759-1364(-)
MPACPHHPNMRSCSKTTAFMAPVLAFMVPSTSSPRVAASRVAARAAWRTWVFTLNLHTPDLIARWSISSGSPDAPWSTSGRVVAPRIRSRRSKSSCGRLAYLPCTLPIVTANASMPVASTKGPTTSGSVMRASTSGTLSPSSSPASLPSSASTLTPWAWAARVISVVQARLAGSVSSLPSTMTESTHAASRTARMHAWSAA